MNQMGIDIVLLLFLLISNDHADVLNVSFRFMFVFMCYATLMYAIDDNDDNYNDSVLNYTDIMAFVRLLDRGGFR